MKFKKLNKQAKTKLVLLITLGLMVLVASPFLLSLNQTNSSDEIIINDSIVEENITFEENVTNEIILNESNETKVSKIINETNETFVESNLTNESLVNETNVTEKTSPVTEEAPAFELSLPSTDSFTTLSGITINYTLLSLPKGDAEISLRIDYPKETNFCVSLSKPIESTINLFNFEICDSKHHEKLSDFLKQEGII